MKRTVPKVKIAEVYTFTREKRGNAILMTVELECGHIERLVDTTTRKRGFMWCFDCYYGKQTMAVRCGE